MLAKLLRLAGIVHLVLGALLAVIVMTPPNAERYGDRLQVALPLIAWGCAATSHSGKELFVRFAAMFTVMHSSKALLGDAPINQRPNGGSEGFPSGHTAAAAFGASALANDCLARNPFARTVVVFAGAYVGASRMAVNKHDIVQVFAGGALGVFADRVLRHQSPARQRVLHLCGVLGSHIRRGLRAAYRWPVALQRLRRAGVTAALLLALLAGGWPVAAQAEVELSLYGGAQTAPRSTICNSAIGNEFVRWQGKSLALPPYHGQRATWWRNATLGYGVEFNHAKIYVGDPASYGYDRLEMTDRVNLLTANIWRRFPGSGPLTPYVGAGIGLAIPHVEVQPIGQVGTVGYQVTGPAIQLVAGASHRLNNRWSLFGEYKGSYSHHRFDLDSGGTFSTEVITDSLNLGASIRF